MKMQGQPTERRSNLHLNVASAIGSKIVGSEYRVGQMIPNEAELGATFGVSRTVVREAVKLLVSKGLLRTGSGIGTWVPEMSEWNFLDPMVFAWVQASENSEPVISQLFAFRSAVEPAAAAEAARNATVAQLYAIESALETMASARDDFARWIEGDVAFHTAIYIASNNVFMAPLANVFRQYFQMSFRVSSSNQHHQHCLQEHYDVFKAIRDRKPEKASRAVKILLDHANADAREVLAETHGHG